LKFFIAFLSVTCLFASPLFGQKIKYKDLYVLLNAKKYDQAEPFLKRFLSDPKNADHPNANLQMGFTYEERSKKNDILDETDLLKENIDSALIFYNKSYSLITEKEVKKREEYYQAYNRRDLRTGKFGVKLSDVQLDIETRIKKVTTTLNNAGALKKYFLKTQSFYSQSDSIVALFSERFNTYNELLLISGDAEITQLGQIGSLFDSTRANFNKYKKVLNRIEKPGYNQEIQLNTMDDFKTDPIQKPDWKNDLVEVWDLNKWSAQTFNIIQEEIVPLKQNIKAYDIELNNLRDKMLADSTSLTEELNSLVERMITQDLLKFDNNPLPLNIFNLKVKELEYISESIRVTKEGLLDSTDIFFQISLSKDMRILASTGDLLANSMVTLNFNQEAAKFSNFILDNYGGAGGAQRYVSGKTLFFRKEKENWESRIQNWNEREAYVMFGEAMIPLVYTDPDSETSNPNYIMKWVSDSVRKELVLSAGLVIKQDTLDGYFIQAGRSRKVDSISIFNLTEIFTTNSDSWKDIQVDGQFGNDGSIFLVYSDSLPMDSVYKSSVVKIDPLSRVLWNKQFDLETKPALVMFNEQNNLVIYYEPYGAESEAEIKLVTKSALVIDQEGNIVEEGD